PAAGAVLPGLCSYAASSRRPRGRADSTRRQEPVQPVSRLLWLPESQDRTEPRRAEEERNAVEPCAAIGVVLLPEHFHLPERADLAERERVARSSFSRASDADLHATTEAERAHPQVAEAV